MAGNILARDRDMATDADFSGWFQFVQTYEGTIPVTLYSREEDATIINIKKAIVSAFQADFLAKGDKEESDPQSQHKSQYSYFASAQNKAQGVMKMTRTISSQTVIGFAQHIPNEEVELVKVENLEFKDKVLTGASGKVSCKLMTKENVNAETDTQTDTLENEKQSNKRATTQESFDGSMTTNNYESSGSYMIKVVTTNRLLRRRRSVELFDTPLAEITSLLATINFTRKAMGKMMELRHLLGDIEESLIDLHKNSAEAAVAHKLEKLIKLEAEYGPVQEFYPAIDDVLDYLRTVLGSNATRDIRMRYKIYFIICPDGSISSQMALLDSFKKAVNDEEVDAIIMYLSAVANPQPLFVAKLEHLISSDVHSDTPLLLAYGALLPKSSPELQRRMLLFLMKRLPQAETDKDSLIHHILSLGNTASRNISLDLVKYLSHPEVDVQLTAILAMRFMMDESVVQKSLRELIAGQNVNQDHMTMIVKSLMYGFERAKMDNAIIPYPNELVEVLVDSAWQVQSEHFLPILMRYLETVNTPHSVELLHNTIQIGNATRYRRDKTWDEKNGDFDLVEPLAERQADVKSYPHSLSYIWGKKFGGKDINVAVAAGAFAGVSNEGYYKLYGHALARARCYDYTLTILEFLVLRKKGKDSTDSELYAIVMGKTVKKVHETQDSTVCKTIDKPVYEAKDYTIFDFKYSIFVVVGTLNFHLTATAQFTTGMYIEFCDSPGRITVGAGLSPTITLIVAASGDLEVALVAKAGLTLSATFNYQLLPEVTTDACYKNATIQIRNCIGIYHQWEHNKIDLYAWYAWRGWCGWFVCTGKDAYKNKHKIDKLSFTWKLPGTKKTEIWKLCDKDLTC